jgi:hypothetical protein
MSGSSTAWRSRAIARRPTCCVSAWRFFLYLEPDKFMHSFRPPSKRSPKLSEKAATFRNSTIGHFICALSGSRLECKQRAGRP